MECPYIHVFVFWVHLICNFNVNFILIFLTISKFMKNGKISQFLKDNWRSCLFSFVVLVGIFCGVWACSQSTPIDIDANRNRVIISLSKFNAR